MLEKQVLFELDLQRKFSCECFFVYKEKLVNDLNMKNMI